MPPCNSLCSKPDSVACVWSDAAASVNNPYQKRQSFLIWDCLSDFRSGGFDQAVEDQAEEGGAGGGGEAPAQVDQAGGADAHAPGVAREPGELLRGRTDRPAARGIPETADFKNDPVRVGEGVAVPAFDFDPIGRPGDGVQAAAAEDEGFFPRGLLAKRARPRLRHHLLLRPFRGLAQAADADGSISPHGDLLLQKHSPGLPAGYRPAP